MLAISSLSVGFEIVHYHFYLKDSLEKVYVNILSFFCSFSYIGKISIKDVRNIIATGYGITIIKGELSLYTVCYSFR